MTKKALEALRLYDVWQLMPYDRGGANGPRGRAHADFMRAKLDAQQNAPVLRLDAESLIDNAATASQNRTLIDDPVTREAIKLNIIGPLQRHYGDAS